MINQHPNQTHAPLPKILLLHASVGMGHLRAATAIAQAMQPMVETEVVDALDYAHPMFRKLYSDMYLWLADRAPRFWTGFYEYTDRPPSPFNLVQMMRELGTWLGVRALGDLIHRTQPDAIVCTHFLPLEVLGSWRMAGLLPPLYCVVTDYRAHQFWACSGADGYFVPTARVADQIVAAGIDRSQVQISGIPIDHHINQPAATIAARRSLDLPPGQPVLLLNGSGIHLQRVRSIVDRLLAERVRATLVVAAGRNERLVAALRNVGSTPHMDVRIIGPQPSLDPWISASDLVIGKAGGLTVSEVLGRGVPLIIPTPVPGQERANAAHVVEAGAGVCCPTAADVAFAIQTLLHDPTRRYTMRRAAYALGHPCAAHTIAMRLLSDLDHPSVAPRVRSGVIALA